MGALVVMEAITASERERRHEIMDYTLIKHRQSVIESTYMTYLSISSRYLIRGAEIQASKIRKKEFGQRVRLLNAARVFGSARQSV
jgi:hypothetical protein